MDLTVASVSLEHRLDMVEELFNQPCPDVRSQSEHAGDAHHLLASADRESRDRPFDNALTLAVGEITPVFLANGLEARTYRWFHPVGHDGLAGYTVAVANVADGDTTGSAWFHFTNDDDGILIAAAVKYRNPIRANYRRLRPNTIRHTRKLLKSLGFKPPRFKPVSEEVISSLLPELLAQFSSKNESRGQRRFVEFGTEVPERVVAAVSDILRSSYARVSLQRTSSGVTVSAIGPNPEG